MLNTLFLYLMRLGFALGGRISPAWAGKIAFRVFATPSNHRPWSEREYALQRKSRLEYLPHPTGRIAVYTWMPARPPIAPKLTPTALLVHGWGSRGLRLGSFVEPLIANGFRVIAFDAPAHGLSAGKQTNLIELQEALDSIAEHFGRIDSVIAHSFGGLVSAYALQDEQRAAALWEVSRLVILSAPDHVSEIIAQFGHMLWIPPRALDVISQTVRRIAGQPPEAITTAKFLSRLPTLNLLVVHDREDNVVPISSAESIAQNHPRATVSITEGLGHHRIVSDAQVVQQVVDFVNKGNPLRPHAGVA